MNQKIVLPLVILLLASSVAVPFALYHANDDGLTSGQASGSDADQTAGLDTGKAGTDGEQTTDGVHTGPASSQAPIARLLPHLRSSTAAEGTILPRLAPLLRAAPETIEPITIDQPVPLKYAALTHPATGDADMAYVATLPPLPEDLDLALGHVVAAHGIATQLMATEHPAAATLGAVTMAHALDQELDTLNKYRNHPVWDQAAAVPGQEPITFTLSTPSLTDGLLDLYGALGLSPETVDALEPRVDTAVDQLPPAYRDALAPLVAATANYQHAVADALPHLATTAGHEDPDENASQAEAALEEVQRAAGQARAAANQAYQAIAATPAGQAVGPGPWSDPLGLIVVGTPGDDTFDKTLGAEPEARSAVSELANTTRGVLDQVAGDTNVTLAGLSLPTGSSGDDTYTHPNVTDEGTTPAPQPGWHMIVLDPGGDDVYHNNAGGIDAGGVRVQVDVVEGATAPLVAETITDEDGTLCVPTGIVCDPSGFGIGPFIAGLLAGQRTEAHYGVPTGIPLAAMVVDAGGNDTYLDTGEVIQGSARGLAMGLLVDADGDDDYMGSELAQGASETWGHAALIDLAGDDRYAAEARAQGWSHLSDGNVSATVFGTSGLASAHLLRHAQGALLDTGGHDDYHLDDLLTGQGMTELHEYLVVQFTAIAHFPIERLGGVLIDLGGPEDLDVPTITVDGREVRAPPSKVNISGWEAAEVWYMRDLKRSPQGGSIFADDSANLLFKTAVQASTSGAPDPVGGDAIRVGALNTTWRDVPGLAYIPLAFLTFVGTDQDVLLFGQPAEVEDPPLLTLTFGEDTVYNGTIARSTPAGAEGDPFCLLFGCPQGSEGPALPSVLVDLGGNDTYLGANRTAGYASSGGLAMLIDQQGRDHVETLHESVGYAQGPGSLAAVIDLDGDLRAISGDRSQAFASDYSAQARGTPFLAFTLAELGGLGEYAPPMALVDLGASQDLEGQGAWLSAGDKSQAYSQGTGIALLVGSMSDDKIFASGWGQGVFDGQQLVDRFCGMAPATGQGVTDTPGRLAETVTPWIGGLGLVLDPSGDDTYQLGTQVGMGDSIARQSKGSCQASHISLLGIGSLVDVRGRDSYHLAEVPERPETFEDRACSGDRDDECLPRDDRTWSVLDEAGSTQTVTVNTPGTIGLGVDNIRNLHHAAVSACRQYEPREGFTGDNIANEQWRNLWRSTDDESENSDYDGLTDSLPGQANRVLTRQNEATPDDVKQEIPQCGGYLALVGALVADAIASQRSMDVRVADVLQDDPTDGGQGQGDTYDLPEVLHDVSTLPRFLLQQSPALVDLHPGPVFINDTAIPTCRNEAPPERLYQDRETSVTCMTIESDLGIGTWAGNDPTGDADDPGDTVACNCSAMVTIRPQQGQTMQLSEVAKATDGLYPTQGAITTWSMFHDRWYAAHERFTFPVAARADTSDSVAAYPPPSAAFPLDLSTFPQGLAQVSVEIELDDAASEESGGVVPPATRTLDLSLVHAREIQHAFLQEGEDGWGLFMVAPGAIEDQRVVAELDHNASQSVRDDLDEAGWKIREASGIATAALPGGSIIDGPRVNGSTILHGAPACASLILNTTSDKVEPRSCWTGMELVVGLSLGDLTPSDLPGTIDEVRFGASSFNTTQLLATVGGFNDDEAEPSVERATEDTYDIFHSDEYYTDSEPDDEIPDQVPDPKPAFLEDVHGLPGTQTIEPGQTWASQLLEKRSDGMWARIEVTAGPGAASHVPAGLLDDGQTEVKVWLHENRQGDRVTLDGELTRRETVDGFERIISEPLQVNLTCNVAGLVDLETVRAAMSASGDITGDKQGCYVAPINATSLAYLLPLGTATESRLIQFGTEVLAQDGRIINRTHALHIDPNAPQGQVTLDESQGRDATFNATLTAFVDTLEAPRLQQDADSDLEGFGLQARVRGENWTEVPISGSISVDDPDLTTEVDLNHLVPENATQVDLQVRGYLFDTSANLNYTNAVIYRVDRQSPTVTETRIVSNEQSDTVVVEVDETAFPVCEDEGCTLTPVSQLPGSPVDPVLDLQNIRFGVRQIEIPAGQLLRGVPYNLTLTLRDTIGNQGQTTVTIDTDHRVQVDASPMADTLVNNTATLTWSTRTDGEDALEITTSAYLVDGDTSCPLLQGFPGVANPGKPIPETVGPLPVQCSGFEEAEEAELLVYTVAPVVREVATARVPVILDGKAPTITLDTPDGWTNGTATAGFLVEDALATNVSLTIDGKTTENLPDEHTFTVSGEGRHTVVVEATDLAGNTATNTTEIKIDRSPPTLSASLAGLRDDLVLVEINTTDSLSGIEAAQLSTPSGNVGPEVPALPGEPILLSIAREPSDEMVRIRVADQAGNIAVQRLGLPSMGNTTSDGIADLQATALAPDRLQVSFQTSKATAPLVLVDADGKHVERVLDRGTQHTGVLEGLPGGSQATITIALPGPNGALTPVATTTVDLPDDLSPPARITDLTAEAKRGAVVLSWSLPGDDVGVDHTIVRRDGQTLARVTDQRFVDERGDLATSTYEVAAVDASGNQGPWSSIQATPLADLSITDVTVQPTPVRPDEPVTVQATIETPAGLTPDVVTLKTWSSELTMDRVSSGNGTSLYAVRTMLPALNVTVEDPSLTVFAQAGGLTRSQSVPAPLVSLAPATDLTTQPNDAPLPGVLALLVLAGAAALITRRWSP